MSDVLSQNLYLHVGVTPQGLVDLQGKKPAFAWMIVHCHPVRHLPMCCHDLPLLVMKNHQAE